jgi:hypothetical protein
MRWSLIALVAVSQSKLSAKPTRLVQARLHRPHTI